MQILVGLAHMSTVLRIERSNCYCYSGTKDGTGSLFAVCMRATPTGFLYRAKAARG